MQITLSPRTTKGKKVAALRNEKIVPATIYGANFESQNVQLDRKTLESLVSSVGFSAPFDVVLDGNTHKVLLREVQKHPFNDQVLSVSFFKLDDNRQVVAEIPIEVIGVSMAIKNNLGFLVTPVRHLSVRALPANIPTKLVVDISNLNEVGQAILIKDLVLGDGVELKPGTDVYIPVVTIVPPQKQEVKATTDEAATGETGKGDGDNGSSGDSASE